MSFSLLFLFTACGSTTIVNNQYYTVPAATDTAADTAADTGNGLPTVAGADPVSYDGSPEITTDVADMTIDLFANDGNTVYWDVSAEQVQAMNDAWSNSYSTGYYYEVGNGDTYADHLVATDVVTGQTADYGKVQLSVVGQSTGMLWSDTSIPDLSGDMDEFQDGLTIGGAEHIRFNNGMVSSIFREAIALQIFDGLSYPAPRTSFQWVGSNVYDPSVRIPYTLVESYHKDAWCVDHADQMGGGCVNIWEGQGDLVDMGSQCQEKECDNTGLDELNQVLADNPPGSSTFYSATQEKVDWQMVQQHMCFDWIMWVGDDYFHNDNNVVLVEGADGKFRLLPYSSDISGGQDWYQNVSLYGRSQLAVGCERNVDCWADTLATCQTTIDAFQALDPVSIVNSIHDRLVAQDMIRGGDEDTYQELLTWYGDRAAEGTLETELLSYPKLGQDCTATTRGGGGLDTGGGSPCN